jgi:hypothetical protein
MTGMKYLSTRRLGHMTETSTGVMETFMNAGGLYAEPCSEALSKTSNAASSSVLSSSGGVSSRMSLRTDFKKYG